MSGARQGMRGLDVKPKAEGAKMQASVKRIELQAIDPQTKGLQPFYGLRDHTHVTRPGQTKTFHDQVGYLLWEPAACAVMHTLTIPRGRPAAKCWQCPFLPEPQAEFLLKVANNHKL